MADDTQKKAEEGKFNGKSLEFVWEGTKLGVRLEGQEVYQFVDLQGVQGEIGATGEPFKIKKTYASVSEMNADFRNMTFGDYVMIASSVEVEDNAKLYTRGESAWIFISDFSGAMGIRGETGLTPNIKVGEVKTLEAGSQAKVTRSGSNEEPVFNFELPKGDKGDDYVLTEEDKVEIGEMVNTEYEERIAENEKDIVDIESYLDSLTPKATAKGELVHITDALNLPTFKNVIDGNVEQETTKGKQLLDFSGKVSYDDIIKTFENDILTVTGKGAVTYNSWTKNISNICKNNPGKTLYFNYEKLETSVQPNGIVAQLSIYYNDGTNTLYYPLVTSLGAKKSYKLPEDTSNISGVDIGIYTSNNDPAIANTITITKPMLTFDENAPYEKYTGGQASPNPEYPQEIEVLEAYNLLDFNVTQNEKVKVNNDGTISINGNGGFSLMAKPTTLKANKNYYIKWEILSGTITGFDKPFLAPNSNWVVKDTFTKLNFTEDKNFGSIWINDASVFENAVIRIWIATEQKPYLPYGCVGTKVNSKNLLPNRQSDVVEANGMTFTKNKDGSLTLNGTTTSNTQYNLCPIGNIYLKPNTYVFSSGNNIPTSMWLTFRENGKDALGLTNVNSGTFTLTENSKDAFVYIFINKEVTINNLTIYPMISLEGGEYEPYADEQLVPLDLKGNWVGAINDTIKDYVITDKKKYWLVKNVRKYTFTGSEEIIQIETNTTGIYRFGIRSKLSNIIKVDDPVYVSPLISNRFYAINRENTWSLKEGISYGNSESYYGDFVIYSDTTKEMTVEEFKQWLSENNVEVYYQLATPEIIELGELPEPIKTFEGTNNIQVLANLDTEIETTYALDLKKYYDNKLAEISAQII